MINTLLRVLAIVVLTFIMFSLTDCSNVTDKEFKKDKTEVDISSERKELESLRQDINQELEKIDRKLDGASGDTKVKLQRAGNKLSNYRLEVEKTLDELENSSKDTWSDVKVATQKTSNQIRNGFRELGNDIAEAFNNIKDK